MTNNPTPEAAQHFDDIVQSRRSVRKYDNTKSLDPDAVQRSLERAVLAANSSNMQLWEFYRVRDEALKEELATYCLGQSAATSAQELVVFVTRRDKFRERAKANLEHNIEHYPKEEHPTGYKGILMYYKRLTPFLYFHDPLDIAGWFKSLMMFVTGFFRPSPRLGRLSHTRIVLHKSLALAAQTFMLSIKAEGYDTCPMEGFDEWRVKKMLKLPRQAEVSMVISVGSGTEEGIWGKRFRVPNEEVIFEL